MNIVSAELKNRSFKLGLTKNATAGALMEGSISPLNTTILNSLGRNIRIEQTENGIELQDEKVSTFLNDIVLNELGELKYTTFHDFIEYFLKNYSKETEHHCIRIQAQDLVMRPIKLVRRILIGNPVFRENKTNAVANCIEFSLFAQLVATKYYPETSVRVITMAKTPLNLKYLLKGQLGNPLADRHFIVLFKEPDDPEGKTYLYILGHKLRETDEQIAVLKRVTRNDPKLSRFVDNLEKKIEQERKKL